MKKLLIAIGLTTLFVGEPLWAAEFTGDVDRDFPAAACHDDPDGVSISMPGTFPAETLSGFDLDQLCLLYDVPANILYVGVRTFEDPTTGLPIPFGDADGDGDPGNTRPELAADGGEDFANLTSEEHFALIFDFDATLSTASDVVAGVSVNRSAPSGFRVSEIALPDPGISFSFEDTYYGSSIGAASGSALFASPSATAPHLEFTVVGFSSVPGFASLALTDPDETLLLVFKAGSLGDTGIGEEDVRLTLGLSEFFDSDGDEVPDLSDLDKDNDGILDITEQDLGSFDTDVDCQISAAEAAASGLDLDGDGDIDTDDAEHPDTDGDGIADYLDTDSDGDTILDLHEVDTDDFDADGDLSISPAELATIDVGGNYPGGNDDGCLQSDELPDTNENGTPDFRDTDSDGDSLSDATEAGDTDATTPPADSDDDGNADFRETDSDDDGLDDEIEINITTDPTNPDTDDDGVDDGDEVNQGRDPLYPGIGIDPDIGLPNSGEIIQLQGSGLGSCSLARSQEDQRAGLPWGIFIVSVVLLLSLRLRLRLRQFFFIIFALLIPLSASAINVEQFHPHFDGLGFINALDSRTLEKRAWSAGMHLSYSHQPLELGIIASGVRVDAVVDYHVQMVLNGAYGLTDWVTLGLTVPFFPNLKLEPVGSSAGASTAAFGDIGLAAKFRIWEWGHVDTDPLVLGLAVVPYLTFPSGSGRHYVGDTNVTGGFRTALDVQFWKNKIGVNVGFRFREKEDLFNLTIGQELLYALAYTRPVWENVDLHVVTELNGSTTFNGFASRANRSPLEWLTAARKGFMDSAVQATLGASLGLTTGYGTPDFRVFGMLTYVAPPIPRKEPIEPLARVEAGRIVILQPIHFETAKWVILSESLPVVQAVADVLLSRLAIRRIVIEGHTDHRGSDAYNDKLSQHRADAVREKLIEMGVVPERLQAKGWGERQPIADNNTEDGMAQNRRVEFHVIEVEAN